MTRGPAGAHALGDILDQARCLLIDFDGPVCDIYAGLTDATVADRLRKVITGHGVAVPALITSSHDAIAVFDYAATVSPGLGELIEAEMTGQEVEAVATARPFPYVHEVVTSARGTGRRIAIVSNNSERAVATYLAQHGLADRVDLISARASANPAPTQAKPASPAAGHHRPGREPGRVRHHRRLHHRRPGR
jgi:phosphoglycolate phosphatase